MKSQSHFRKDYFNFTRVSLQLHDMDIYGHLNNNKHHQYFDNAVNLFMSLEGGLCMRSSEVVGVIVESGCSYFKEVYWPETRNLDVGIRTNQLGNSSVQYGAALFFPDSDVALAQGYLTHVWIDRHTRKAVPIPDSIRRALQQIMCEAQSMEVQ